jgi:hypothetical protein
MLHLDSRRTAARWSLVFALLAPAPAARADAADLEGFGLDAQLTGGGGFAFGHRLDNYFLGRGRVGGLYAHHPVIANLGLTLELGGLARFGAGGELELNHGSGPYASLGLARVSGQEWMTHLGVGFMIFGVEWQHRLSAAAASDALMFHVRVPIGIWWLHKRQEQAASRAADTQRLAQLRSPVPEPRAPVRSPSATAAAPGGLPPTAASALPLLPPAEESERAEQLEAARSAHARGDHAAEERALARAQVLRPEAASALALAAAQTEQGRLIAAESLLARVLATYTLTADERARAEAEHSGLHARIPHLRLLASGAQGDERVLLDGAPEPSALAGYDVPLDPGEHQLQVERAGRVLSKQHFHAAEGELVRLSLELAP